jgi:hypothetical protein
MTGHNRLAHLAAEISKAQEGSKSAALLAAERALAAGHMLIEAKTLVKHGEWAGWLAEKVSMSERTARRYMQLARSGLKTATVADLGIWAASEALSKAAGRSRRSIIEGRIYSAAEKAEPGFIQREIEGLLDRGEEPTRIALFRQARHLARV